MNMKRITWLILILALSLPTLTCCSQPGQAAPTAFDALARRVPGDAESPFFLDLKPDGEAGRHWERMRLQLEANPTGQEGLNSLSHQFRVEEYGLGELIPGPAVNWYGYKTEYVIAQVSDEEAAGDALRRHFEDVTWEPEQHEGKTLYHGRNLNSWRQRERLAWTIHDGLLYLSFRYDQEALAPLKALVSVDQADSLASLPAWRTLRDRLPETPMGLMFFNVAEQARSRPPAPDDTSLSAAMSQQLVALAAAAVPEEEGMRVEIAGTFALQTDAPPAFHAMLNLPAVDPSAWTGLPADTAIALVAHDASVLWPWLREILNLDALDHIRDTVGLDLEADLAGAEGPLTGDFALAITPPLPDEPISQGLLAGQLLILTRGASEAHMAKLQAAMEDRGAVFGPREIEGVALQTQTGTEPTGYAISYGFDGDTLLFGSSPDVIGQGATARREGEGLVTTQNFRAILAASSDAPSLVIYLNSEMITSLAQANMTEEQYQKNQEYLIVEAFESIGVSLRFAPDELEGVIYFFIR
jgi:hypothetical protein